MNKQDTDKRWVTVAESKTSPIANTQRKEVQIPHTDLENIIFVGAEMYDRTFWTKMMFIGAAFAFIRDSKRFRPAQKYTLAYVDNGYTKSEKLALEYLKNNKGFQIKTLSTSSDIAALMNQDRDNFKLQDVAFFSHGLNSQIALNFSQDEKVNFDEKALKAIKQDIFLKGGCFYSYACRTGVKFGDESFEKESDAEPENSLAQLTANHFGVVFHAYLRRTDYSNVLRSPPDSKRLSDLLNTSRSTAEGQVIDLPPEHEALPHAGLLSWWGVVTGGAAREGTKDYALWRKKGGLSLPVAATSPKGLPDDMRAFRPNNR